MGIWNYDKNAQDAVPKYENDVASGKLEGLRLFVPKDVANKFRQVAKKSRMTPHELLEEMVEIYKRTVQVTASFVL
jgi:predicted PilT family ATPase